LEEFIMDMACELNDMELDAVSGGKYHPKAPHFNFHDVTFNQGNSVTTGAISVSGGSGSASVNGGSNTITFG
jgi:hypothetical protein